MGRLKCETEGSRGGQGCPRSGPRGINRKHVRLVCLKKASGDDDKLVSKKGNFVAAIR
jgi:hypothetical protein